MFEPYLPYLVESVEHLNGQVVDIGLKPIKKPINYSAGQFAYVSFSPGRDLKEPHPFTISSAPDTKNLRFTIKRSGDWTGYLVKNLKVGMKAAVHGGFGMFSYQDGGKEQIWIAGGIGVTPFVSWIRDFKKNPDRKVAFFYSVRGEGEAVFWDEFKTAEATYPTYDAHINYSLRDGYLTADEIVQKSGGNISKKEM